jgi:hypothetical protein
VVVVALDELCALDLVALDEATVVELCPEKPCAATADTAPVAATAPAISHRLIRRTRPRPASRLASARGADLWGRSGVELESIARSIVRRQRKTTVSGW